MVWIRGLAMAGVIWCAGLLVATTLPGGLTLPIPVVVVSALLPVVPGFVVVVVSGRRLATGPKAGTRIGEAQALWRLLRAALPGWLLVASWLLFTGFWLVSALSFAAESGVVEKQDGAYVVNNHGERTVISEAEYLTLKTQESRSLVATAGAFGVGVAVLSTALLHRKANEHLSRPAGTVIDTGPPGSDL